MSGHSVTSAREDITVDNNGTLSNAYQFGSPPGTTWTLIGQTFEMNVKRNRYDMVPLLIMNMSNGRIIVDDQIQRVIHLNVSAADIQNYLPVGTYVYDLVMMDGSSPPLRVPLMHGYLTVEQGVTYP